MKILCLFILLICFFPAGLLYGQTYSEIVYDAGTNIEVLTSADVCANSIIVNGTFSGGGTFCTGPLPVRISEFSASVNKNNVALRWITQTELNNSGFDIERSLIGGNAGWAKIAFVAGFGTANEPKEYLYEDKKLQTGKYRYRLKQIDFNGNYEYFGLNNEVSISKPSEFSMSQNYPNPSNPKSIIDFAIPVAGRVSLIVYDILGKEAAVLVNDYRKEGYYTAEFNGSNFSSGIYIYRLQTGDFVISKKLVLVK